MKPEYRELDSIHASGKSALDSLCQDEAATQLHAALKSLPFELRQLVERRFGFQDRKEPTIRQLALASGVSDGLNLWQEPIQKMVNF